MDKIIKYFIAVVLATALLIVGGCGTDTENKTSTPVRVNFGTTAKSAFLPTSVPAEVTNIKITVTAADMVTISESYSVTAGHPFTAFFEVPSGQNRIFKVDALNSLGATLYSGQTSHTLAGIAVDIPVNMDLVTVDGIVGGKITNSKTGAPIGAAVLNLRSGTGNTSGTIIQTSTTDSSGNYNISKLPAGTYTAEVLAAGYTSGTFTITYTANVNGTNQNFTITPIAISILTMEGNWIITESALPSWHMLCVLNKGGTGSCTEIDGTTYVQYWTYNESTKYFTMGATDTGSVAGTVSGDATDFMIAGTWGDGSPGNFHLVRQ